MASIFKRKDTGKWYVQWYYNGRLLREKVGKSKEAAQMRLSEIVRKIETGQYSYNSDTSLDSLIKSFKGSLDTEPHSESYKRRLGNIFNNFENYFNDENIERLNQIDFPVLDKYITKRINIDGIAHKTANMEIDLLRRMFDHAVKYKFILESPARDLKRKKVTRKEPRFFTNEEIELLLEKAGKYEPFFMVLLHTGLRASDAGNLTWTDIDLEKNFIRVIQEKTDRRLTIPINDSLRNYLLDYATDSSKLFPSLDTDKKREKVRRFIQSILRDAECNWKGVGCHTFRHTFASHLVINGASIYDVQKLLGHRSINMTQVYAHLSEDATRRAVDLLNFRPINDSKSALTSIKNQLKL